MGSTALEQRHGFVEPSLAPPQFSEAHEPLPHHGRAACCELVGGACQLPFGFLPCATPHAHRGVLRAAHGKQRAESPLRAECLETIAPLHSALVVPDALTSCNQVAAGETN